MAMLELNDVHTYYGNIHALKGVSLYVDEGEIVTLIGGNGAGKTTTLNTISGLLKPRQGTISLEGKRIDTVLPHKIVEMGVSQAPEGRRIFARLTVRENLEMGAYSIDSSKKILDRIDQMLERFPLISGRKKQLGGTLSGGEQQMLAIARGLMAEPKLMLMDEPSMGLAPVLVEQIFDIIEEINKQGTSILLVEQNAQMALSIAHRAYVLETGKVVLEGNADEVMRNSMVIEAYLGG